eukprot:406954-Alexandrium_andersonii.AAC.1
MPGAMRKQLAAWFVKRHLAWTASDRFKGTYFGSLAKVVNVWREHGQAIHAIWKEQWGAGEAM